MKMKKYLVSLLLCLTLVFSTTIAFASSVKLNIPQGTDYKQPDGSMWCWAASNKCIIQFIKGSSKSQSDIVYDEFGNRNLNQGATLEQVKESLGRYGLKSSLQDNGLSFNGVISQINNNNHPIFARIENGGGLLYSHANTIRGYDTSTNMLYFEDPYDGLYHAQNFDDYSSGVH